MILNHSTLRRIVSAFTLYYLYIINDFKINYVPTSITIYSIVTFEIRILLNRHTSATNVLQNMYKYTTLGFMNNSFIVKDCMSNPVKVPNNLIIIGGHF